MHPATTPLPPPQEASSSRQPQCSCNFNAPCQLMGSRVRTTDSTRVNDVSTTGIECQLSILNVRWKIVRRFEATFSSLSPPSPRLWLIRGKVRSLPARVEFFSSRFDEMRFYFRRDGWKGFSRIEFRAFSNRSLSNSYIYNPLWIISTRLFSGCGKPWLMEQCGANYRPSLIIERSSRSNCYFNPPSPPEIEPRPRNCPR